MVTIDVDGSNMAAFFEAPTCLLRVFEVIKVLGMSFTSVRSVADSVRHFVTGDGQSSSVATYAGNDNERRDIQPFNKDIHVERFLTFIDNLNFMHPEIFSARDSFGAFN